MERKGRERSHVPTDFSGQAARLAKGSRRLGRYGAFHGTWGRLLLRCDPEKLTLSATRTFPLPEQGSTGAGQAADFADDGEAGLALFDDRADAQRL
jgi:hypothetical protein